MSGSAVLEIPVGGEVLQLFGNGSEKGSSKTTIHDAVVIREGQVHHMTDTNSVAFRCFQYYGSFLNGADCEYGYLRLVDDGSTHQASKSAYIGQGESSTLGVFGSQLILTGIVGQGIYLP